MKKQLFILIFLIVISLDGISQDKSGFGFFTDRDVYASGETVLAKIYTPIGDVSRIGYLDLVNLNSKIICGVSFEIINHEAAGFLNLPDSLSTGTYLLRSYLKNSSAKQQFIREIWITNRFDGLEKTNQMKRLTENLIASGTKSDQIEIGNIKAKYQTNSVIDASIKIEEKLLGEIDGKILVCVAQTDSLFQPGSFLLSRNDQNEGLTENRGIILSGTVTVKQTSEPVKDMTVYLSIPDSVPGIQYYQTQKDGRFYFLLDKYYGSVDAVIQCFSENPLQRLKVTMDELFAEPCMLPKFRSMSIPEEFVKNINRDVEAVTFQKIFNQEKLKLLEHPKKRRAPYPYYGYPSITVNPQLFIDLPNFSEISKELLPGVKFRNYNNEPSLQIINAARRFYFDESPLVLIDGIPINDLNVIKDMGTADIKRIDICQNERFYGNLRFPGIVAIYTTKADYSRLPESDQFLRLKLETIQQPAVLNEPELPELTVPDLRQAIVWNPEVDPKENLTVKCRTSSITGQFKLVVRGRLKDGTLIYAEKQFEVK